MQYRLLSIALMAAVAGCSPTAPSGASGDANPSAETRPATPEPAPAASRDGPFGLAMGMTREEVREAMGRAPIEEEDGFAHFDTAPKPHPQLSDYLAMSSPTEGLCKVVGVSTVESNRFGHQVSERVNMFVAALTAKYGQPSFTRDRVLDGSLWDDPEDYMMGLLEQDRLVVYVWDPDKVELPGDLRTIAVMAEGLSTSTARISVGYEFENMQACSEENKRKSNEAL